jgi:hypothetical protein
LGSEEAGASATLASSHYYNQQLHDRDKWDETAIAERSDLLFEGALKLWPRVS